MKYYKMTVQVRILVLTGVTYIKYILAYLHLAKHDNYQRYIILLQIISCFYNYPAIYYIQRWHPERFEL